MKRKKTIKAALIITTYKRPGALKLVLNSALRQSVLPDEIIVGDDGSGEQTASLIKKYQAKFPIPLKHVWQEDKGFRVGKIRNKAIKSTDAEYIIHIDGDILMHKDFIKSHLRFAERGFFLQGHRVMLNGKLTKKAILENILSFSFFDLNIKNRKNSIHSFFLANIFSWTSKNTKGLKGAVFSFWREDAIQINGFDENFYGWGKEDSDFSIRLINKGVKRKDLRFCSVSFHLDHANSNKNLQSQEYKRNLKLLKKTIENHSIRCINGIEK